MHLELNTLNPKCVYIYTYLVGLNEIKTNLKQTKLYL